MAWECPACGAQGGQDHRPGCPRDRGNFNVRTYTTILALLGVLALLGGASANADEPSLRIVSTSGIPHRDVADYRTSPAWKQGMPKGANEHWRTYMRTTVGQITAGDPDVVLHTGDMVEGRWYTYRAGTPQVYGPRRTWREKHRMIHRAADTVYPWVKQWWAGVDVLWGMGDHEIGDIGPSGVVAPDSFRYRAHDQWVNAWKRHFGPVRHATLRGNVGIVTLDPFVKWDRGVFPQISGWQMQWLRDQVAGLRADGAQWVIVQSETPAIGPNRPVDGHGTSGLLLDNGDAVWRTLADLDVDLLLAAEFHDDTAHTTAGGTPMQVVHGGSEARASWLTIDVYADRLALTLRESVGDRAGTGRIWAPTSARANSRPVPGVPSVTGRATVHADGRVTDRTGLLQEGVQ